MIKFGLRALLVAAAVAGPAAAQSPKPLDTADPVLATVDGTAIRRSDVAAVQRTLPAQFQQVPLEMLYPAVVERLIDSKLVANAGRKDKLEEDPEVKRRLTQFEDRLIQDVYLTRRVEAAATDKALRDRYDTFVKSNPPKEELSARHILVQTEAQAKEVIGELAKGGDFAEIAKAKSMDPSGKSQGGSLGFFGREDMVPEFSAAAFAMKAGETSKTPVKTQFGWHVIKVEERRQNAPSFDEMREQLTTELSQEIVGEIVGKLREGAKVERFGLDGSPRAAPAR